MEGEWVVEGWELQRSYWILPRGTGLGCYSHDCIVLKFVLVWISQSQKDSLSQSQNICQNCWLILIYHNPPYVRYLDWMPMELDIVFPELYQPL